MMRILNPEVFQGNKNKKNYFEGWYFKNISNDGNSKIAIIPGISTSDDPHAFIQIFDATNLDYKYFKFPINEFIFHKDKFYIEVDENRFSKDECYLNIDQQDIRVEGNLKFTNNKLFPKTLLNPGAMGIFSFVPFMQANHGIISMDHDVSGEIKIGENKFSFEKGRGYLEKDWGTSFPNDYLWLQANNFSERAVSVMLSVAKIPWLGSSFIGFLGFALLPYGELVRFATYNFAKIESLKKENQKLHAHIIAKEYDIEFEAKIEDFTELKAPIKGAMRGVIEESLNSEVKLTVLKKDKQIYQGVSEIAGLEIHNKILDYFK